MRLAHRSLALAPTLGLAVLGVIALWPAAAHAEPDDFGLGTGIAGASDVTAANTVVNVYAPLSAAVAAGATSVTIGTALPTGKAFAAGELVLLYQATGADAAATSGAAGPFELDGGAIGHFEFARISSITGSTLDLTAPLVTAFPATGAQVIYVPEFTSVTVGAAGSITATAWNGSAGGVIAFLSQGAVALTGGIDADQTGFRGGLLVNTKGNADIDGCTELDPDAGRSTDPAAWGQKGEGLTGAYGPTVAARGNLANGAGGGDCDNAGGGGGANVGVGGQGGNSWSGDGDRPVGGLPGAAVAFPPDVQLMFGGGGGAGQENNSVGSAGGQGGGIVFFRATQLTGTGTISARGQSIGTHANDGQGGGGAGGTVSIRLTGSAVCTAVDVSGGHGGSIVYYQLHGPGGGGGAGAIYLETSDATSCALVANAGQNGTVTLNDGGVESNSGQPGAGGSTVVSPGGFATPSVPNITQPIDGEYTVATPTVTGTAPAGSTVDIYVDGVLVGTTTADGSGNFSFTLTSALAAGSHTVTAEDVVDGIASGDGNSVSFAVGAPTAPTITSPTSGSTVGTDPTIAGTAVPGSTVTIYDDGTAIGTTTADSSGNYSFTPTTDLPGGSNTLTAEDTSDGQNSVMSTGVTVTVVPGAPVITSPTTGESVSETPTISGTAVPGSTVTVYGNGIEIGTATADASGNWTVTSSALAPGAVSLTASDTDNGETGATSSGITVNVVPPAPVVTSPTENETVGTLPELAGTAPANSTVQVIIDGTDVGTATANSSGDWTFTPSTALSSGGHTVDATDTVNGETSPGSATIDFTVGASSTTSGTGTAAVGATTGATTGGVGTASATTSTGGTGTTSGTTIATTTGGSASATTTGGTASATTAATTGGTASATTAATTGGTTGATTAATTSGTTGGTASATTAATTSGTTGGTASATTATTTSGTTGATTAATTGGTASATTGTISTSSSGGETTSSTSGASTGHAAAVGATTGATTGNSGTSGSSTGTTGSEEADGGVPALGGGGCNCSSGQANPGTLALLGVAAVALRRRKRR